MKSQVKSIVFSLFLLLLHLHVAAQNRSVQRFMDSAMHALIRNHSGRTAMCAVMEVQTGKLVWVSAWRLNENGVLKSDSTLLSKPYEDKGLFKLITYGYLLEHGKLAPDDSLLLQGEGIVLNGFFVRDAHNHTGMMTLEDCFARSSDVGFLRFIQAKTKFDANHFFKVLENQWHINQPIVPDGFIKQPFSRNLFREKEALFYAIGRKVQTDALHWLMYYNAIANGGMLLMPGVDGKNLPVYSLDPSLSRQLKAGLQAVMTEGTGKTLDDEGNRILAKTSTNENQTSFSLCGFFPADQPRYTMLLNVTTAKDLDTYSSLLLGDLYRGIVVTLLGF